MAATATCDSSASNASSLRSSRERCRGERALQHIGEWHWPAEMEALAELHVEGREPLCDRFALDVLGDRRHAERACRVRNRRDDRFGNAVSEYPAHEPSIYLEERHGQLLQVRERAQTRTEVIERDFGTRRRNLTNEGVGGQQVRYGGRFLDFEAEQARRKTGRCERLERKGGVLAAFERLRRDIQRECDRRDGEQIGVRAQRLDERAERPSIERGQEL